MTTLKSCRIRNFKAVRDSKTIKFGPLTVFIGNNGSGKSSIFEALETYQAIVVQGLDLAMQRWLGFEHVHYQGARRWTAASLESGRQINPMAFDVALKHATLGACRLQLAANSGPAHDSYFIQDEIISARGQKLDRSKPKGSTMDILHALLGGSSSLLNLPTELVPLRSAVEDWQFLSLQPENMGLPQAQRRTAGAIRLAKDGSNIAEYLLDIRERDLAAFEGILEALHYVLPYAKDVQPQITQELERKVYLQLAERDYKVQGWLLSTGTLRVLALLALLRHPTPPPVIFIEEIENGLDPRTLHLLVEEIRTAVTSGATQIIATTHSPYLLDLLTLEHLVLVERNAAGEPVFQRPVDNTELQAWTEKFTPGRLYTMGGLSGKGGK